MTERPAVTGNLLRALPDARLQEQFKTLLQQPGCRIEQIVSQGQCSAPDFWYDQGWDEWVLLLSGRAEVVLADPPQLVTLLPGSFLWIPAHRRHRVTATTPDQPSVWLAIHLGEPSPTPPT